MNKEIGIPQRRDVLSRVVSIGLKKYVPDGPTVADSYPSIASSLLRKQENGVSVFTGGPLEHRKYSIDDAWLTPIEVKDEYGYGNFHVIWLNASPEHHEGAKVELVQANSVDLKLRSKNSPSAQSLHEHICSGDKTPRILVIPTFEGNLYYPNIATGQSIPSPVVLERRVEKLFHALDIPYAKEEFPIDLEWLAESEFHEERSIDSISFAKPRIVPTADGDVYVYPVIIQDDIWKRYEIYSLKPIEDIDSTGILQVRIDSGCEIGQKYLDLACECSDQLFHALQTIRESTDQSGIIIHIPTQDGRGYGMNTKMETEGIKRGVQMVYNDASLGPLKTVGAAQLVFGEQYDIRTYDGAGRILRILGAQRVQLMTDNRTKIAGLKKAGIDVMRQETETEGNEFNKDSLEEKLNSKHYYPKGS